MRQEGTIENHAMILALDTYVPKSVLTQERYYAGAAKVLGLTTPQATLLKKIVAGSRIDKRHLVVSDFLEDGFRGDFLGRDETAPLPSTGRRNQFYKKEAPGLAEEACRRTLQNWGGNLSDITHIISVSCTGMIAPGIEFLLVNRLGLSKDVQRLGINFMGCFGAFRGIAVAKALALEHPSHRVLVICTEICSLHFQGNFSAENMVANAIFSDGSAAIVVGAHPCKHENALFEIHAQKSAALSDTQDLMTWEAGDQGYAMRLDPSIPSHLEHNVHAFADRLLGADLPFDQCTWAVHPGGKAILESITKACRLHKDQLSPSWSILKEYGNMSSPTFLFVLKEILSRSCKRKWVAGLGFGPGLSVEGIVLKRVDKNVAE